MQNPHDSFDNWLPLESSSDVIHEYIQSLGGSEILTPFDIYSFDVEDLILTPQPVLGALFTFPCTKGIKEYHQQFYKESEQDKIVTDGIYYMKQTANNACGTIGILHILLNLIRDQGYLFSESGFLKNFYQNTVNLNPEERADYLKSNKQLKFLNFYQLNSTMHKGAVHQGTGTVNASTKVRNHFVAFIWNNGCTYELDGRKNGPINYGECDQCDFLLKVADICRTHYIEKSPGEVGFNLMAIGFG